MFKNSQEIEETLSILKKHYDKSQFLHAPFAIESMTIVFAADSFFDPYLTITKLMDHGVMSGRFFEIRSEVDKVIIDGANLELLRKLDGGWPIWENVTKTLEQLDISLSQKKPEHIFLEDEGRNIAIKTSEWERYFEMKGEKPNAWNTPTYKQFCQTLGMFGVGNKQGQEAQPQVKSGFTL